MNYLVHDEFGYSEYAYLDSLLKLAINKLNVEEYFDIIFIDDEKMHEMNKTYRNIDRTTDVLSFAYHDAVDNIDSGILGEIYISIPKMKEQALEYGHSEKRELSFLVIHGLLHLLGYDHMNKEDEKKMFDLQKEVLIDAGITE